MIPIVEFAMSIVALTLNVLAMITATPEQKPIVFAVLAVFWMLAVIYARLRDADDKRGGR